MFSVRECRPDDALSMSAVSTRTMPRALTPAWTNAQVSQKRFRRTFVERLPPCHPLGQERSVPGALCEAGDGVRTHDPQLGKLMLYQLSYARVEPNPSGSECRLDIRGDPEG